MEHMKILNEYYTNLDYDKIDKNEAWKEVLFGDAISEMKRFHRFCRSQILINIIQKHFIFFASICKDVDKIHSILNYLRNFAEVIDNFISGPDFLDQMYDYNSTIIINLLLTLYTICAEENLQYILTRLILPFQTETVIEMYKSLQISFAAQLPDNEMIILEDSDLYAIIRCLIKTTDCDLYKIWVHERVKEKFLWLIKEYYHSDIPPIDTFQSLKDIQFDVRKEKRIMKTVSIWSEDIVVAKNFALFLNSHIVFINTYMDFCGNNTLLCYKDLMTYWHTQKIIPLIHKNEYPDIEESVNAVYLSHTNASTCNLFYDGTWQKPIKGMYWKHNDTLCANATNYDIAKCYESAEKGFETWRIKSIKIRTLILSKLVSILKDNSKFGLAALIERWLKSPYLYENIQRFRNAKTEIMHARNPLGVIILKEKSENVLFFRLMQILIAGNSVIVMFSPNFYNLAPYCDMFSTCGIPPGVINLLSHEDTSTLEKRLCSGTYTEYADYYFVKCNSLKTYVLQYEKLTLPKVIILQVV